MSEKRSDNEEYKEEKSVPEDVSDAESPDVPQEQESSSETFWERLRKRVSENRWMTILAVVVVVLIPVLFIVIQHSIRTSRSPEKAAVQVERPGTQEPVTKEMPHIWAQPTGKLTNQIPTEVVFRVSHTGEIPVEVGGELSPTVVRNAIRFKPEVPGKVVWLSENNFAYKFQKRLMPGQRYDFEVKSIPVSKEQFVQLKPKSFYFSTPDFEILSAYLINWSGPELSARVEWNLPLRWVGIEDLISVETSSGEPVPVIHLRRDTRENSFVVSFKNTGDKAYDLFIKRGFSSTVPDMKLERDVRLRFAIPKRELYISRVTAEESGMGYSINVICTVQGISECKVDRNVKQYLDLQPPVKLRVLYHSHGFRLVGDFLPEQIYQVTIRAGLSAGEATLREDFVQTVKIPAPSPQVQFAVRGRYLGRHLGIKLPIRTRSVSQLQTSIWRLPPENIVWASSNMNRFIGRYGEPVLQNRKIAIEVTKAKKDQGTQLTWLDLSDLVDSSEPGVYRIQVKRVVPEEEKRRRRRSPYSYRQTTDTAVVVITDLTLITKKSKNKLWVWAVDATTGSPRSRVQLSLYSQKNVLMGTGITDTQGYCEIAYESIRNRRPALVTGRQGDDFTYLALRPAAVSLAPFSVSGVRPAVETYLYGMSYRAYFYPERNLYRPGETLHFAVLLREESTFRGLSLPVKVSVRNPRGKQLTVLTQTTSATGLAAFQLALPKTTPTGNYSFNVIVGEKSITFRNIFVETFVPERMRVEVTTDKKEYRAGESIWFKVQGDYLFGAPASEENYKFHCTAREGEFSVARLPEYHFGKVRGYRSERPHAEAKGEGTLDSEGAAEDVCNIQDWSKFFNRVNLRISVEVEEAGSGRVSRGWTTVKVHPFPYYIGLKSDKRGIEPGKPVTVKGVLVNYDGSLKKDVSDLLYQTYEIHHDYVRVWNPQSNRFSWERSQRRYPTESGGKVQVTDGKFELSIFPTTYWRDYLVEVRDPEGATVGELMIRGWGWYGDEDRPESPEILDIQLNEKTSEKAKRKWVDYGETVSASALLPFEGRILWTLELDKVMRYEWQKATGEVARFSFTVPEGITTVYVSALLIRTDKQYLVRRAFGVHKVKVRPSKHRLPLTVKAPERMRPGEELNLLVQGSGRYSATVAIVDQGILQITRFQTPDVYNGILRDQALRIKTSETLGWIIHKAMAKPGGGEEKKLSMEFPSLIRLVSYWSGVVESDADGKVHVQFKLPQYLGKLRVMVSAVDETRMASTEEWVTVTTEVVVLPTPPRFLYTGDNAEFPVALKNTTDYPQEVKLNVSVNGQKASSEIPQEVPLKPNESKVIWVPLQVSKLAGVAKVLIDADWGQDQFSDTLQIPILPNRPFETEVEYLETHAGTTDIRSAVTGWMPEYQKTRITLTPIPGLSRLHHLKYLVKYPYGCVEQTSSSLLPMVRIKPLLKIAAPDAIPQGELENYVHSGIGRLISMQTPSGGFAFWPGGRNPAKWASIYATFVLLEAKDAGYTVPESMLQSALNYVERYARAEAFGYFVLARGERLQSFDLNEITELNKKKLSSEERLFTAGALFLAGRPTSAERILRKALKTYTPANMRSLRGNFYSALREYAVRLYIRELMHPGAAENEADASALIQMLQEKSYYYSTQQLAWSMLALGMRIQNATYAQDYTATLVVDGETQKPHKTEKGLSFLLRSGSILEELQLEVQSDGILYAMIENAGFRKAAQYEAVQEKGLEVEKRILNETGNTPEVFQQREVYFVEIIVTNKRAETLYNVAIEDFLPAGFEVENPRLPGTADRQFIKSKRTFTPEYVDYRDERVQAFGSLSPGKSSYFYMLRAVTSGEFMLPPVNVVVMYDPEIRAASAVGSVILKRAGVKESR